MSDENQKKIFSNNLNYFMELNDKTQIDLINDLGFNKSTVSTWCAGSKMPRMGTIQTLSDYFGILKSDLIDDKSDKQKDSYYFSSKTRQIAQEIFEDADMRMLFDLKRGTQASKLMDYARYLKEMQDKEEGSE